MADTKISALPASTTPLTGTETLPIVQGGVTKKVSVANLTAGRAVATAGGSFTDNLVQGTAAKGVNFTANTPAAGMTSQLLNWYEEGTWTPTFEGTTGSAGSVAYSEQAGTYTRIGNRVILTGTVILTNVGSWTGNVRIGGVPFNSSTASGSESIGQVQLRNVTSTGLYVVADLGRTANNKIAFINVNSGAGSTNVDVTNVANNGAFLFTIVYKIA